MECHATTKNIQINKKKAIGEIIIVVEGQTEEFKLLKHIFTNVLDYNYISLRRNKTMKYEFKSKTNNNTVIIANTSNSEIRTIMNDDNYKDKLYNLLKKEYHRSLKNTPIYIIWDRDRETTKEEYTLEVLKNFTNAMDNNYDMNGLLLLSYPCLESYELSNFDKKLWKKNFKSSKETKITFHQTRYNIHNINEKTLLLAVENMHRSLLKYNILDYNPSDFGKTNETIFRKQTEAIRTPDPRPILFTYFIFYQHLEMAKNQRF